MLIAAGGVLGAVLASSAETVCWCGGASGSWATVDNWVRSDSSHGVPQPGDKVVINAEESAVSVDIDASDVSIGSIEFDGTNSVELTGLGYQVTGTGRSFHARRGKVTNSAPLTLVADCEICASNIVTFLAPVTVTGTGVFTIRVPQTDANASRQMYFRDRVTAPGLEFKYPSGGSIYYYGPVSARKFWTDSNSSSNYIYLYAQGNAFDAVCAGYWGYMYGNAYHVFPTNMVCRWNGHSGGYLGSGWYAITYSFSFDQIIDRIESKHFEPATAGKEVHQGYLSAGADTSGSNAGVMPMLELRPTADAATFSTLVGSMNLTYDSVGFHTQTFSNACHTFSGTIELLNGAIRNGGTNVFTKVTDLVIGPTARFEIADVENRPMNPLPKLKRLLVRKGGQIEIPSSLAITCRAFSANGTNFTAGTYTHADVSAIVGGGSVTVSEPASNVSVWIGAGETASWTDAANWAGGVPTADSAVDILSSGDDVTQIVLPSMAALPTNLYLSGSVCVSLEGDRGLWNPDTVSVRSGAKLDLPTGAAVSTTGGHWQFDGGTLGVSGGTFAATNRTNSCGRFYVRGNNVHTGRVDITGGWWRYHVKGWDNNAYCRVNGGGEIRCTAGSIQLMRLQSSADVLKFNGGRILVSGTGVLHRNGNFHWENTINDMAFSDDSALKPISSGSFRLVAPYGATSRVVWHDNFDVTAGSFDSFIVSSQKSGHGILEINSDKGELSKALGCRLAIGCEVTDGGYPGFGELILKKGSVSTGYRGVLVGSANSSKWYTKNCYPGGKGILRVEGGTMNAGSDTAIDGEMVFYGFMIGEAGQTHANGKHLFRGEVYLSGGTINQRAHMVVGGARGEGVVEQTGGEFSTSYGANAIYIGLFGGTGSYTLGGGTFTSHRPIYIGGADKARVANYAYLATNYPKYPFDDPTAEGLLSITGGTFVVDNKASVWVGCRGKGVISVTGTRATSIQLYNGNLILSNSTLTVNGVTTKTSSTLRFILDETAKGVTPIDVHSDGTTGGTVVNTDGTRVEVALGEMRRDKNYVQLMKFKEWEGPVPELVATGVNARCASLDLQSTALYLRLKRGLVLIVK